MSFIETHGKQNVGYLVLQHQGFRDGKFDLDYRAHKRAVRITDRDDKGKGIGGFMFDKDAVGDLHLGMCWKQQQGKREMPMWSFHYPSRLVKTKGTPTAGGGGAMGGDFGTGNLLGNSVPTGQAGASFSGVPTLIPGSTQTQDGGPDANAPGATSKTPMTAQPIGDDKYDPDDRMIAITVPPYVLKATGPTNPNNQPGGNNGNGGGGGNGQNGPGGANPGGSTNPNQVDTGGPILYLGIGGRGQNFGPQGTGLGSAFPTFSGVNNFFGGHLQPGQNFGAGFSGVANLAGGSGGKPGVSVIYPTGRPGQP